MLICEHENRQFAFELPYGSHLCWPGELHASHVCAGAQEALWRAAAFADAGADMLFIDALASEEEMRAFCRLGGTASHLPKVNAHAPLFATIIISAVA